MSDVTVLARTQVINVNPATASVSVINAGPQGPPGAHGDATYLDLVEDLETLSDALATHIVDPTPHPAYDDMPSLTLLFENGLV